MTDKTKADYPIMVSNWSSNPDDFSPNWIAFPDDNYAGWRDMGSNLTGIKTLRSLNYVLKDNALRQTARLHSDRYASITIRHRI